MLNFDTIFLLVVVALIFQRLWSVLGTRPESQIKKIKVSRENAQEICNILRKEAEKAFENIEEQKENKEETPLTETDALLAGIPGFSKADFINGAQKAFQVITSAFNNADTETLKILVSPSIFKKMQEIIEQRKAEEMTVETDFICFDKAEIAKVSLGKTKAKIMMEFVSQQVNVLRNKEGDVLEGDENYIQTIADTWTFEKDLNPKVVNWILVSTKKQ